MQLHEDGTNKAAIHKMWQLSWHYKHLDIYSV